MSRPDSRTIQKVVVTQQAKDEVKLGDECIAIGGPDTSVHAGEHGVAVVKGHGHAETVECGVAVVFGRGRASGGTQSVAIAGLSPYPADLPVIATAGPRGVAIAGVGGQASAGPLGAIIIIAFDPAAESTRAYVAQTDPCGPVKPDKMYHLDSECKFVEV